MEQFKHSRTAESLFPEFCKHYGLSVNKIPECCTQTPDYLISDGKQTVCCELKDHGFAEDERISALIAKSGPQPRHHIVGQSVRRLIGKASGQFKRFNEYPCLLLIYCRNFFGDLIEAHHVNAAMYGFDVLTYNTPEIGAPTLTHWSKGHGRKMTPESNTKISAVALFHAWSNDQTIYTYHNIFASIEFPLSFFATQQNYIPTFSNPGSSWIKLC